MPVGDPQVLTGPTEVGTGKAKDEDVFPLSTVITLVNEKFGTDFDDGDRLFMEQVVTDLAKDETLAEQALDKYPRQLPRRLRPGGHERRAGADGAERGHRRSVHVER